MLLPVLGTLFLLSGCATGTALVTGTRRAAISAEAVTLYTEFPERYEVIGIVTAYSDAGWTAQDALDYAAAELKKQAARIGANGVVLESATEKTTGGVFVGNAYHVNDSMQYLSGKAIYADPSKKPSQRLETK